jgi:hypothetical protein
MYEYKYYKKNRGQECIIKAFLASIVTFDLIMDKDMQKVEDKLQAQALVVG